MHQASRHYVCTLDELAPGTMRRFDIGQEILVVIRSDAGETFALDARCPHQGALLCKGKLRGFAVADGVYVRRGEVVRCPLHVWDFDARTGQALNVWPPLRTAIYPVEIEGGRVYVGAAPLRAGFGPALEERRRRRLE